MNTEKGNKLIAEFMGNNGYSPANGIVLGCTNQNSCCKGDSPDCATAKEIKYHKSWDWLMPVIEKIESIPDPLDEESSHRFVVKIQRGAITIYDWHIKDTDNTLLSWNTPTNKLNATWNAVVKFIKWYNKQ